MDSAMEILDFPTEPALFAAIGNRDFILVFGHLKIQSDYKNESLSIVISEQINQLRYWVNGVL